MPGADDTRLPAADADLALLADAAWRAGAIAMRHFAGTPDVWNKHGGSPVTEADIEIDRFLNATLLAARPDYGWLSEETADDPARLSRRRLFVVDPIDGTRAFVAKSPWWAVSLAVVEDTRPVAAALFEPVAGRMMLARAGVGAWESGARLSVTTTPALAGATASAPRGVVQRGDLAAAGLSATEHMPSLALRIARVAEGRLDVALASARSHDWDLAAADLLVQEAGGCLRDADGRPVCYNASEPRHPALVASNRALKDAARGLLAEVTAR